MALGRPDWSDHSHSLAFTLRTPRWRFVLHAMFNAYWEPLTFELPRRANRTGGSAASIPRCRHPTISARDEAPPVTDSTYRVQPHSCVVLVSPLSLPPAELQTTGVGP